MISGANEKQLELANARADILLLQQENQELKKQLEDLQETHYLIQGGRSNGKTYLMKLQADKEQLNSLVNSCQEEIRKLKEQLAPNYYVKGLEGTLKEYQQEMNKVAIQQKEFINYLENKIYSIEPKGTSINYNCEYDSEEDYIKGMKEQSKLNTLKEILSKFKEIIGENNE